MLFCTISNYSRKTKGHGQRGKSGVSYQCFGDIHPDTELPSGSWTALPVSTLTGTSRYRPPTMAGGWQALGVTINLPACRVYLNCTLLWRECLNVKIDIHNNPGIAVLLSRRKWRICIQNAWSMAISSVANAYTVCDHWLSNNFDFFRTRTIDLRRSIVGSRPMLRPSGKLSGTP
jgi:hypothetical protein